ADGAPCRAAAAAPAIAASAALSRPKTAGRRATMPAACRSPRRAPLTVDDLIDARGRDIERVLHLAPRRLQHRVVGIGSDEDRLACYQRQAPERQVERGAIPTVELDAVLGCHRHRVDRPSRMLRELHDAHPGYARDLRHVGGEGDIVAVLEGLEHFAKGADAALAIEFVVVRAGAANGADAELFCGTRVNLAVAVTRDQHLGAEGIVLSFDERCDEMLAVPQTDDDGQLSRVVNIGRLDNVPCGAADQAKITGAHRGDGLLKGG